MTGLLGYIFAFVFDFGVNGITISYVFLFFVLCVVLEFVIQSVDLATVDIDLD